MVSSITLKSKDYDGLIVPECYVKLQELFFPYPSSNLEAHIATVAQNILNALIPLVSLNSHSQQLLQKVVKGIQIITEKGDKNHVESFLVNEPAKIFHDLFKMVSYYPECTSPEYQIIDAIYHNRAEQADKLLTQHKVNVNRFYIRQGRRPNPLSDSLPITPILPFSCKKRWSDMTKTLLKHGANPKLRFCFSEYQTALYTVCTHFTELPTQINFLIDAGSDVNEEYPLTIKDPVTTPINIAAGRLDGILGGFLIANGALVSSAISWKMQRHNILNFSKILEARNPEVALVTLPILNDILTNLPKVLNNIVSGYADLTHLLSRDDWKMIILKLSKIFNCSMKLLDLTKS